MTFPRVRTTATVTDPSTNRYGSTRKCASCDDDGLHARQQKCPTSAGVNSSAWVSTSQDSRPSQSLAKASSHQHANPSQRRHERGPMSCSLRCIAHPLGASDIFRCYVCWAGHSVPAMQTVCQPATIYDYTCAMTGISCGRQE